MGRSVALVFGGVVLALLVASQLALPPLASRRIEHRLTERGGSAHVSLHAFPALRLLFHRGSSVEVTGRGLNFELDTGKQKVFDNLDGFGEVHVRLDDVTAGPFTARRFTLDRDKGHSAYQLGVAASFTPSALASYLGSRVGGGLGGLFGGVAGGLVPGGSEPLPVNVSAALESRGGTPRVQSGTGTVAGVPLGPVLEVFAAAIVARL
jgi:hypothetical protein